jgi:glyoxylase-like metal-dependent hydrolase (beta-lactamase superfamily II)
MISPPPAISRRHFLATSVVATAAACLNPRTLLAQQAAQQPPDPKDFLTRARAANASNKITATPLRRNITFLGGAGGNIAVLAAKEGKLLVDSGYASCQPQLTAALAAINSDPIQVLINTHWHFDHTDGNEWMHSAGATIWAHENTRYRMSTTQNIVAYKAVIPPAPICALPTILFNSYRTLSDQTNTLKLTHYEPAHTDTDVSVHFTEADILHCGDTFWNGFYPFIDYSSGGNINGMIGATEQNLATAGPDTIVIPGHGPLGNKAQLTEFRDMLVGARDNIAKLKKEGKSLDEIIAAKPTTAFDAKWGKKPDAFIGYVYQGV